MTKDITTLLVDWSNGDQEALNKLIPLVYDELHRLAIKHIRKERRPDHTIQPSALVNEVYLKLVNLHDSHWQNRARFFSFASHLMYHILVDYARKRRVGEAAISLSGLPELHRDNGVDLIALDDALQKLKALAPRQYQVVIHRYFGGLTIEEAALALQIGTGTVKREWDSARTWLLHELSNCER